MQSWSWCLILGSVLDYKSFHSFGKTKNKK
jgi:hypothetical protein